MFLSNVRYAVHRARAIPPKKTPRNTIGTLQNVKPLPMLGTCAHHERKEAFIKASCTHPRAKANK